MQKALLTILSFFLLVADLAAQCSICTKTAQQMGEETGRALNAGILYLAAAPMAIAVYLGYRWWKSEKSNNE